MTFHFGFKKLFIVIFSAAMLAAAILIAVSLMKIFGIGNFFSSNPSLEWGNIIATALNAVIFILIFAGSKYVLGEEFLIVKIAFISFSKIPYDNITNLRVYKHEKRLTLGFMPKKSDAPRAFFVLIPHSAFDPFCTFVRSKNTNIIYDTKDSIE